MSHTSLDDVELGSRRGDDVTVGPFLAELYCLLFLQNQEAVELGSCLFLVVVLAQVQQAQ